ncbi:hypothetical protein CUMW_246880 [Citrus unshiu]|uniref:Uncharacterized protein n=1 Tax=Citrus unshiu TaxID=55188 RepID=A0A2H5QNK1_CITUN|nr:hypothetical protein CUMW_246880 [Citrus unshiu]
MGGIGKTTLVKEVSRQAMEAKLFDMVVFSEVSQTPDIKKIQQEIAEKLGLELREEVESRRASRLFERLRNEKKILVVLDNIWKHLNLETVGIPFGEDHKGCKLLLTARDRSVLLKMGSKDNFLINNLKDEEAGRLFKMMAGDDVENRELKSTAIDVARACGGLPIALSTVAKALRGKSLHEWKNSLRELRTPSMVNFEGVSAETYSSIELSFNHLKGKQLKKIFLLGSLMGNGIHTLDLFKYSMGLGIFKGVNKMEDARDKLYALVHELRDSCLLLEGDSNEEFSMHDVVRDVAISIACRHQHVFSVRNEDVWDWPDEDALRKCNAISLRNNSNREFPEGLECPNLEFLYISLKDSSLEINIPENFFVGMKKLRVLDFTRMQFSSFPSSIDLLVNLHTLCLDQSALGDIAIIGKLKNLEVLSFFMSDIMQLPEELGQLNKLRLLDLTNCFRLKVIAPNLISSLTRLEELYMGNCFIEWEVERANSKRSNASLDELMHLPRLTTLEIHVKNDSIIPEEFAQLRSLSLGNLPEVTSFCREVKTPSASPNRQVSQEESTAMYCSSEITLDISTPLFNEKVALPNLEALEISEINVNKIWHYNHLPVMFPRFQNLTRLIVWRCHKLKYIFSASMIGSLKQLQHLDIRHCEDLQEIISENRADQVIPYFVFPQLTTLGLQYLPKLRCLYPGMHTSEWPALESLLVRHCDKLKIFAADLSQNNENDQLGIPEQQLLWPLEKIVSNFKELSLSGKDVKMILQADFPQHLFGSLKQLEIVGDDSTCFPIWNVLERFHNLEILTLLFFSFDEEVFSEEGSLEKHVGKLAMIKELKLYRPYHLKQLGKQDSKLGPIFQYLEILEVYYCARNAESSTPNNY